MVIELQPQPVAAKEHTGEEEEQQGRYAKAIAPLADDDTGEDEYGTKEKDVFGCESHVDLQLDNLRFTIGIAG